MVEPSRGLAVFFLERTLDSSVVTIKQIAVNLVAKLPREWEDGQWTARETGRGERSGDLLFCHVAGERAVVW